MLDETILLYCEDDFRNLNSIWVLKKQKHDEAILNQKKSLMKRWSLMNMVIMYS